MTPPLRSERILSTLNDDGTRRWLQPRVSHGRFLDRRRIVGYALIALFVALPFLRIGGRPALLLDVVSRELSVFGAVFRPSDGFILMLLGLTIVVAVFLVTALFGRVWCGWGCPQTVYLELVFRPVERWLEGTPGRQARLARGGGLVPRRVLKWAIYIVLSCVLANVFLAYFVGVDRLGRWVLGSPLDHPGGFSVVAVVAALMLFDFAWFREQMCIVACPYGRLQSVLLDRQSLIVGYDAERGEPRGKPKTRLPVLGEARGDCVDCNACVTTCPTGIDIREGLQMECVGCAQCIDACDVVMDKLDRPRGLIGYTSQDVLAGKPRTLVRVRTIIYPAVLVLCASLLGWAIGTHATTEITIGRVAGPAFIELPDGKVASALRIKLENESDERRRYTVTLRDAWDCKLRTPQTRWEIRPRKSMELPLFVDVPRSTFVHGRRDVYLRIDDDAGYQRVIKVTLLGPEGTTP
ncbi:MAG: cytochrome c oxidase accessory protein CcoG [Myxococcota bacterium]|nr:cytochrome c oxidase accessory protein CcoG [Myxococcota bacterium]